MVALLLLLSQDLVKRPLLLLRGLNGQTRRSIHNGICLLVRKLGVVVHLVWMHVLIETTILNQTLLGHVVKNKLIRWLGLALWHV